MLDRFDEAGWTVAAVALDPGGGASIQRCCARVPRKRWTVPRRRRSGAVPPCPSFSPSVRETTASRLPARARNACPHGKTVLISCWRAGKGLFFYRDGTVGPSCFCCRVRQPDAARLCARSVNRSGPADRQLSAFPDETKRGPDRAGRPRRTWPLPGAAWARRRLRRTDGPSPAGPAGARPP